MEAHRRHERRMRRRAYIKAALAWAALIAAAAIVLYGIWIAAYLFIMANPS